MLVPDALLVRFLCTTPPRSFTLSRHFKKGLMQQKWFVSKLLFVFILVAAARGTARADIIIIVSQTYRIQGYGYTYPFDGPPDVVLYDETTSSPSTRTDSRLSQCANFVCGSFQTMTASTEVCCLAREKARLTIRSVPESGTSGLFLLVGLIGLLV